uniref:Uncharacterized protein n=1 Tax=Nonomuraea gerenzanensis TaxID=93944 RepID=A0A1M4ELS9_9ACTN|nr:hypothetical protein BN4615_P9307 [Nonomuraea gerenzanensis]
MLSLVAAVRPEAGTKVPSEGSDGPLREGLPGDPEVLQAA